MAILKDGKLYAFITTREGDYLLEGFREIKKDDPDYNKYYQEALKYQRFLSELKEDI